MFFIDGFNSLTFTALLLTFLVLLYIYLRRDYNYWISRGIKGPRPILFIGTLYNLLFYTVPDIFEYNRKRYGKVYGTYLGSRPVLIVADPELIKTMNIRDFHIFVNRNDLTTGNSLNDRSLFNLLGDEWKKMRSIISPTFSSGKMRKMHPLVEKCVERLVNVLLTKAKDSNNEVELKQLMGNLTMDVIATCAFGTQIDTHNEPNNLFVTNAKKALRGGLRIITFFMLKTTFPKIIELTQFQATDPSVVKFFRSAITSILSRRKTEINKHNDYLQLMINANKKIDVEELDEDSVNHEKLYGQSDDIKSSEFKVNKTEITEDDILATSFLFFVAGYDTTSSLLSFLFYSLALHPKCQQKLYEEVLSHNGMFDYDNIAKMPYLDACIAETLRLYNPLAAISRLASEDYKLGDTGITIPKGMLVNFDIQSIHRNPEYYPNPTQYNPERFLPENRDKLTPYTYLPFGIGPRNCVGMRFALMEAKTAIVHLVHKFKFVRSANTQIPLQFKKLEFLLATDDVHVGVELRQ